MRIVHLSDAHFNPERSSAFINNIVKPLIKDLLAFHQEKPIDLICFTGDLIDKGGFKNAKNAFDLFKKIFIEEILSQLNLSADRFLMIPGNHDVERHKIHKYIEKQLQQVLIDKNSINENMDNSNLLNLERLESYKTFQDNFYSNVQDYQSNTYGYSLKLMINGKKLAIAGINSSWRCCDENDRNRLIVGRKQLEMIMSDFQNDEFDIKIGLMHHPYDHLLEIDKDEIEGILTRDFDLLLTGHVHRSSSHLYQNNLGHGTIRSIASANWNDNVTSDSISHCNGYTLIDFNHHLGQAKLHNRKYSFQKLGYIPNVEISQNEDGTSIFELPTNDVRTQWKKQSEVIDKIKSNYLPILDEKLLVYNTDTRAPKDLESIFVLPKIVVKQTEIAESDEFEEADNKEEILNLESLSTTDEHLFLLGDRESGKSTLLYRVLQFVTKTSLENKRLPVYIDLKKSDLNNNVTNEIALYLGVKKEDVESILKTNKILLLLDNINFNRNQEKFLNRLTEEMQKYPNIIVISTSEHQGDGEVPIEYITQPFFSMCKVATIKHFQSNQIRTLMKKWFGLKENEKLNEKFENIVETFHSLNIPTTPMAVSMFLWIVEKQEEYKPKNNAAMLQNFIEKLLNKHTKVEVRSDEFDFYNQNSLLVHISKKMFETGNVNYQLSSLELKTIIKNHFNELGWTPKGIGKKPYYDWIPEYFASVGLFIEEQSEEDTFIKFRLNCFFQYFLMQNIDIDDEFKKLVFHEDHYLEFLSEIDYYTALYRDKTDALKRVITLMNQLFDSIDQSKELKKLLKGNLFDEFFKNQEPKLVDQFKTPKEIEDFVAVSKITEEKEDEINDILLEDSNSLTHQVQIVNKEPQKEYTKMKLLERSWILGARVLKNSEESKDSEYKKQAYNDVLENSLVYMYLYYGMLIKFMKEVKSGDKESQKELANAAVPKEFLELLMRFLPSVHQMFLFQSLGTSKLDSVFKEHLDKVINDSKISLIHKFTALFMYTDLHPNDEKYYLMKMIPNQVKNVVKDFVFTKLNQYESKQEPGNKSLYPELMKQLLHMGESQKYHPQRQSLRDATKSKINKKRLIANVKKGKTIKGRRKVNKPKNVF